MAAWGELEYDEKYEEKKEPCLVADANQVSSPPKSTMMSKMK